MPHPDIHSTPAYRKAFAEYMRRGTPIDLSLKAWAQKHSTAHPLQADLHAQAKRSE